MSARLDCDVHLVPMDPREGCPYCVRFLMSAPDPATMSRAERLDELERWLMSDGSVPYGLRLDRVERLLGRQIDPWELEDPDRLLRRAFRPPRQHSEDFWA